MMSDAARVVSIDHCPSEQLITVIAQRNIPTLPLAGVATGTAITVTVTDNILRAHTEGTTSGGVSVRAGV